MNEVYLTGMLFILLYVNKISNESIQTPGSQQLYYEGTTDPGRKSCAAGHSTYQTEPVLSFIREPAACDL
jgi:hypothetical protein